MKTPRPICGVLCAGALIAVSGCATVEKGRASHTASATAAITDESPYPMWTRVTGWLLTPLTGASANVDF